MLVGKSNNWSFEKDHNPFLDLVRLWSKLSAWMTLFLLKETLQREVRRWAMALIREAFHSQGLTSLIAGWTISWARALARWESPGCEALDPYVRPIRAFTDSEFFLWAVSDFFDFLTSVTHPFWQRVLICWSKRSISQSSFQIILDRYSFELLDWTQHKIPTWFKASW